MDAQFYADWWKQMFEWSPHLDLIAPQDSMGANGNSFSNVSEYLSDSNVYAARLYSDFESEELFRRTVRFAKKCEAFLWCGPPGSRKLAVRGAKHQVMLKFVPLADSAEIDTRSRSPFLPGSRIFTGIIPVGF